MSQEILKKIESTRTEPKGKLDPDIANKKETSLMEKNKKGNFIFLSFDLIPHFLSYFLPNALISSLLLCLCAKFH